MFPSRNHVEIDADFSAVDDDSGQDGRIKNNPADASQIDRFVALANPVDKPDARRYQI